MKTVSIELDKDHVSPGEDFNVYFTSSYDFPGNAWIGIIPSHVQHGNDRTESLLRVLYSVAIVPGASENHGKEQGILDTFRSVHNTRLIALDGTWYFSSQSENVTCENCLKIEHKNGEITHCQNASNSNFDFFCFVVV